MPIFPFSECAMNIFDSYIDAGQELTKAEKAEYYVAIIEYLAYQREPQFKKAASKAIFTAIKPSLDESRKRSEGGKKGMQKRYQNKHELDSKSSYNSLTNSLTSYVTNPLTNPLTKSNSKSKSKETTPKGVVKKPPHFSPPSAEEVKVYADSLDRDTSSFDSQRFVDFYVSKGWKVGTSPMKDWRAAVRNWIARDNPAPKPKSKEEVELDAVFAEYGAVYDAKSVSIDELDECLAAGGIG